MAPSAVSCYKNFISKKCEILNGLVLKNYIDYQKDINTIEKMNSMPFVWYQLQYSDIYKSGQTLLFLKLYLHLLWYP